jgi:hypothetical protein
VIARSRLRSHSLSIRRRAGGSFVLSFGAT